MYDAPDNLPLDCYVLSQWTDNAVSGLDPDARRKRLARDFVALGAMGRFLSMAYFPGDRSLSARPPQEQWAEISSGLRTEEQHKLASVTDYGHIWLRTCYTEGSDEKHDGLLENFDVEMGLESEDLILNDAGLYSYGSDWTTIFTVLPEILLQLDKSSEPRYWMTSSQSTREHLQRESDLLECRKKCAASQPATTDELIAAFRDRESEAPYGQALRWFHLVSTHNWLIVADEEAMQTGHVLLVFFDDMGRVVRQGRRTPEDCMYTEGAFVDGCIDEDDTMCYGEPGPDYGVGGACGPPFTDYEGELAIRESRWTVADAARRPSTPELGPAYFADRERVQERLKPDN